MLLKQVHNSCFSLKQIPSSPSSASSCLSVPPCQERLSSDGWKVEGQRQACTGGPDWLRNQEPPEDDPGSDPNMQGNFGGSWGPNPPLPKEPLGEQRSQPPKLPPDPLRGPPGQGPLSTAGELRASGWTLREAQGGGSLSSTLMAQHLVSGDVSFRCAVTPNLCPEAARSARGRSQMLPRTTAVSPLCYPASL